MYYLRFPMLRKCTQICHIQHHGRVFEMAEEEEEEEMAMAMVEMEVEEELKRCDISFYRTRI